MSEVNDLVLTKAQLEQALESHTDQIKSMVDKANAEAADAGKVSVETKSALDKLSEKAEEIGERLANIEQRDHVEVDRDQSLGETIAKSDRMQAFNEGRTGKFRMELKAITNATGLNQPLVHDDRQSGIYTTPNRILTIRDLLPSGRTSSNMITFTREASFTNAAAPTVAGSPEAFENVAKAESTATFTLVNEAVSTIAHYFSLSKQVLADAPALASYIDGRLRYGLALKVETQLLNGTGANHELNGLITQATSYTLRSPQLTNEIDIIRDCIRQAHVGEYRPDFLVLNPSDFYDIEIRKVGSSDDRYVVGNPADGLMAPRIWGLPVVVTNSISSGTFLLGSANAAMVFDREQAAVTMSDENNDNFTTNMVDVLAEERLALAVFRTEAFLTGSL